MAHHQGMSFLSLAYLLLDRPMQKRFESDPLFQATTLLLQERIPKATRVPLRTPPSSPAHVRLRAHRRRRCASSTAPNTPIPEVQLLSNGRYHVMVTNAGGGYSRWKDIAVTRWREDTTCDNWGTFCYIRDVTSGEFWSTAYQPTLQTARRLTKRSSRKGGRSSARRDHDIRHAHGDRRFAGRRHRVAPRHASPTARGHAGPSTSPVTRKSFWLQPPPTPCIRRSAICLCRPRSSASARRFFALAGPAPATSRRHGCFT